MRLLLDWIKSNSEATSGVDLLYLQTPPALTLVTNPEATFTSERGLFYFLNGKRSSRFAGAIRMVSTLPTVTLSRKDIMTAHPVLCSAITWGH